MPVMLVRKKQLLMMNFTHFQLFYAASFLANETLKACLWFFPQLISAEATI